MIPRLILLAIPLLLSACSSGEVRDTLGLTRRTPDEFVVVARPSLVVPPDFNLAPPEPGKEGPRHSTEAMAKTALFGDDTTHTPDLGGASSEFTLEGLSPSAPETAVMPVMSIDTGSAATSNFLSRTGAQNADPEIRGKLGADVLNPPEAKQEAGSLYEQLTGADQAEPVIDPKGESERLRTNKDAGKKANEGEVVTEEKKKESVLDRLW